MVQVFPKLSFGKTQPMQENDIKDSMLLRKERVCLDFQLYCWIPARLREEKDEVL